MDFTEYIMIKTKDLNGETCYVYDNQTIVRCRDCRYFCELIPGTIPVCLRYGDFKENDYCSHGERKDA